MPRHESAFQTDDPILIAVGNCYRQYTETKESDVTALLILLEQLAALLTPPHVRPEAKAIVATSLTLNIRSTAQESYRLSDEDIQQLGECEENLHSSVSITGDIEYAPDEDYFSSAEDYRYDEIE